MSFLTARKERACGSLASSAIALSNASDAAAGIGSLSLAITRASPSADQRPADSDDSATAFSYAALAPAKSPRSYFAAPSSVHASALARSEENTSELHSLMPHSHALLCLTHN